MTFEQFKYVLEITKTGSINQAATNLFISQAALSTTLKNLEEELGNAIFTRNNRGIQLTAFGREFVSYITPICTQMVQLEQLCRQQGNENRLSFSVASNGFRFISPICAKLYKRYQPLGIHIYHLDGIGDQTIDYVANHQVEIGIIRIWDCYHSIYMRQFYARKLFYTPIITVNICVVVGKGNPLFQLEQPEVSPEQLADFPMVVPPNLYSGPFSDIFMRLKIPQSRNCIIAGSRAVIYDTLDNTDAYYLSSDLRIGYQKLEVSSNYKSFLLENCDVKSEIGWIRSEDYMITPIAKEFIHEISWIFLD